MKIQLSSYKIGDRIEMIRMGNDPDPIPKGARGTITFINELVAFKETQIGVKWDNGRTLMVLLPYDQILKVKGE